MRRLLMLLMVAVVVVTFAAPVTASPEPCVINCYNAMPTDTE